MGSTSPTSTTPYKLHSQRALVNAFYDGDRRFDVTVRIDEEFRDAVDDVADLPIALPGGAGTTIPLGFIADVAVRQGAGRVAREAGARNVAVKANLLGRDQGSFVAEAMGKVERQSQACRPATT